MACGDWKLIIPFYTYIEALILASEQLRPSYSPQRYQQPDGKVRSAIRFKIIAASDITYLSRQATGLGKPKTTKPNIKITALFSNKFFLTRFGIYGLYKAFAFIAAPF